MINEDTINYNELKSLIDLTDDPDETIFSQIRERLISIGSNAIPELEKVWETSSNELIQHRLEGIIHDIHFNTSSNRLKAWLRDDQDLLEGFIALSTYQYPQMDTAAITKQLGQISRDVWLELNDSLTALENVKVLNHVLYNTHGFKGNTKDFYNASNFYINSILENKKGSPIGLSIIYSIIAQSLRIPIYGVNLPEHFVLAYMQRPFMRKIRFVPEEVMFYINPFNMGTMFARNELELFLRQMKVEPAENYFIPCSNSDIIRRVLFNLIASYEKNEQQEKSEELRTLLPLFDKKDTTI